MASEPVRSTSVVTAPKDYSIPHAQQIQLLSVQASFIDNGAASTWIPAVQILDNNGNVLVTAADQGVTVTAGGSADVSWFPFRRGIAAQPAPSPNPLGTLYAWYDFAATSTLTLDGSGNIAAIADKSGNGHDLSNTDATQRPATSLLNGLNAGRFASASLTCLYRAPLTDPLVQPFTIAIVFTQTVAGTLTTTPGPYGGGPQGPNPTIFVTNSGTAIAFLQGGNAIVTALASPFTQQQITGIGDGASSVLRLNGVAHAGTIDNDPIEAISLGVRIIPPNAANHDAMDGQIGECLIYNSHLSATQLSAVEAYLKAKWGTP